MVGQGNIVRKRGERLEVWSHDGGKVSEARIREISKVCLYGGVEITTPAMVELMQRNVPVLHFHPRRLVPGNLPGDEPQERGAAHKAVSVGRG